MGAKNFEIKALTQLIGYSLSISPHVNPGPKTRTCNQQLFNHSST